MATRSEVATPYSLPNVGLNENALLGVSELRSGQAWAVGYYVDANYEQKALVEHYDGTDWSVLKVPQPGAQGNILCGVAAVSANAVWAVGGRRDAGGVWHPLMEHWDGSDWSVSSLPDSASATARAEPSELLYAVSAASGSNVYAVGQTGRAFPSSVFTEHWDGSSRTRTAGPVDSSESLVPLGLDVTSSSLTIAGERESDTAPNTTLLASGPPSDVDLRTSPFQGTGENDLFSATTAARRFELGRRLVHRPEQRQPRANRRARGGRQVVDRLDPRPQRRRRRQRDRQHRSDPRRRPVGRRDTDQTPKATRRL